MDRFRSLDDVQLAILLSLVARNHCLITTDEEHLDRLQQELERVSSNSQGEFQLAWTNSSLRLQIGSSGFGLSTAVVKCTNTTTLDEFTSAIFVQDVRRPIPSPVVSSDVCILQSYREEGY